MGAPSFAIAFWSSRLEKMKIAIKNARVHPEPPAIVNASKEPRVQRYGISSTECVVFHTSRLDRSAGV